MPTLNRFTREQWRDIEKTRARLRAWKDKFQIYPAYPENPVLNTGRPEVKPIFKPRPVDAEIDQVKAGFLFLQNKLNEHLDASKKKRGKY